MQLISLLLEKETISLMEMQHFEKSVTLLGTETGSCYLAWLVQYQPPNQQSPFWITLSPERSGKCHPESTSGEVTQDLPFWKAAPQLSAFFFLPPRFFFFSLFWSLGTGLLPPAWCSPGVRCLSSLHCWQTAGPAEMCPHWGGGLIPRESSKWSVQI